MDNTGSTDLKQLLMSGVPPQVQLLQMLQQQQQQASQSQQAYTSSLAQLLQNPMGRHLLAAMSQQQNVQLPEPPKTVQSSPRQVKTPKRKSLVKENQPPVDYSRLQGLNQLADVASAQAQDQKSLGSLKVTVDQDHHFQPLSSTTSVDEGVHTSSTSPADTHSGPVSPLDMENEIPKEGEHGDRKRPAAIMELLNNKKRRLELKKEGSDCESSPPEHWSEVFNKTAVPEDDTETTSSTASKHDEPKPKPEDLNTTGLLASLFGHDHDLNESTSTEKKYDVYGCQDIPSNWNTGVVYESPMARDIPHDEIFSEVPGRLSLLSNVTKHKMTVAEVRRRVLGPEAFNFSLLGALLRRAKMPEKSQALFDDLQKVGLSIPRGRRRNITVSLLSALTEAESEQLVNDFGRVSEEKFPVQEFVEYSYQQTCQKNLDSLRMRAVELNVTKKVLTEFLGLLKMDRSEIRDMKPTPILPAHIQDPLSIYSMLTHGFGTPGLQVGVKMLGTFVDKQLELLTADVAQMAGQMSQNG
uniref:TF_AP-2 domain-containing protein n=1 Tax=Bursaphelenchus xylophilus TaxID=6326 RepID=A0A1I7RME5_BURXY